jgi:hypothetical protein
MSIIQWLKKVISGQSGKPSEVDRIPDIIGRVTDEQGQSWTFCRGSLKHKSLSTDQLRRVARLREVLSEAYPMTMEAWIDGFLRDLDPEREIRILEAIAAVYARLTAETNLSTEDKQRLYDVLCLISAGVTTPELTSLISRDKGLPEFSVLIEMVQEACSAGFRP